MPSAIFRYVFGRQFGRQQRKELLLLGFRGLVGHILFGKNLASLFALFRKDGVLYDSGITFENT